MADISMCFTKVCPLRGRCHRHTSPQGRFQSFLDWDSRRVGEEFPGFWSNEEYPGEYVEIKNGVVSKRVRQTQFQVE